MGRLRSDSGPAREPQPHDLVLVVNPHALIAPDGGPLRTEALVAAAESTAPSRHDAWVVVRRTTSDPGFVSVGIRGRARAARFAAQVSTRAIARVVRPWEITLTPAAGRSALPAFEALALLERETATVTSLGRWGPGGSVGFELVTGRAVVTDASDLDVVLDAPAALDPAAAASLLERMGAARARVDIQAVAAHGAFSLSEWVRERGAPVAVRTTHGPILVDDPWQDAP